MKHQGLLLVVLSIWIASSTDVTAIEDRVPLQEIGGRIINGLPAGTGQFPWQAAIYVSTPERTTFCGGSLVSEQWIVTAGHCVFEAISFLVYLGSTSLTAYDPNRLIVNTTVSILHEEYDANSLENDIGLISLGAPVVISAYIRPIALDATYLSPAVPVLIPGWGVTSDDSTTISPTLHYITILTIANYECNYYYTNAVAAKMVCAVGLGQSTCAGDSGGGLIAYNNDGAAELVGTASFVSSAGCQSSYPSGYTRISYFLTWIENAIRQNS